MAFSASDAAFEGFRITRERPVPVLVWSLVYFVISMLGALLTVASVGDALAQMSRVAPSPEDAAAMLEMMSTMLTATVVRLPLDLLWFAVLSGGVFRTVFRPADSRFAYLRLGADELRLAVAYLILLVISVLVLFASTAIATLAAMPLAAMAGATFGAVILTVFSFLGAIAGMIYFGVRLLLVGPATFVTRRIDLKQSWVMTKGRFWAIFASVFLAAILSTMIGLLGLVVIWAATLATGGTMADLMQPDTSTLASYFTPARFAQFFVAAVISTLQYVIIFAPAASIYAQLTGRGPAGEPVA